MRIPVYMKVYGRRKEVCCQAYRNDIISLTKECADVTGIPYVMESDMKEAERILFG